MTLFCKWGVGLVTGSDDAFREIAISEEAFRNQLSIYSSWDKDKPAITPKDIRPLVLQSLPWLKPTAAAKMQLARIKRQREDVYSPKAMQFTTNEVAENWKYAFNIVKAASKSVNLTWKSVSTDTIPSYFGEISVAELVGYLKSTKWIGDYLDDNIRPKAAYYEHCFENGLLKNFIVIFPQLMKKTDETSIVNIVGVGNRTVVKRKRIKGYYGEFTDERHRDAVTKDILLLSGESAKSVGASSGQGVILAYLIPERGETGDGQLPIDIAPEDCTLGLTIYLPTAITNSTAGAPIEWEGSTRIKL